MFVKRATQKKKVALLPCAVQSAMCVVPLLSAVQSFSVTSHTATMCLGTQVPTDALSWIGLFPPAACRLSSAFHLACLGFRGPETTAGNISFVSCDTLVMISDDLVLLEQCFLRRVAEVFRSTRPCDHCVEMFFGVVSFVAVEWCFVFFNKPLVRLPQGLIMTMHGLRWRSREKTRARARGTKATFSGLFCCVELQRWHGCSGRCISCHAAFPWCLFGLFCYLFSGVTMAPQPLHHGCAAPAGINKDAPRRDVRHPLELCT